MSKTKNSSNEVVWRMKNVEGKKRPVICLSQSSLTPHAEYNLLKEGCTQ